MNKGVAVEFTGTDGKKHYGEYLLENMAAVYAREIKQVPVLSYSDYDVYESYRNGVRDDWQEYEQYWYDKPVYVAGIECLEDCETCGEVYEAVGKNSDRFLAALTFAGIKDDFFGLFDDVTPSQDDYEMAWEDTLNGLDDCVDRLLKDKMGIVLVMGSNLDWRGRGGYQYMNVNSLSAKDIVNKLTPNCEFSIRVFDDKDGELYFVISHHDCPTGSRMRFIPLERVVYELMDRDSLLKFMRKYLKDDYCMVDEKYMYEKVLGLGMTDDDYCITNMLDELTAEQMGKIVIDLFDSDSVDDSYKEMIYDALK